MGSKEDRNSFDTDLVLVGLGPGDEATLPARAADIARAAVSGEAKAFFRTESHPVASRLIREIGPSATAFDSLYEQTSSYEDLYEEMARRVVAEAVSLRESGKSPRFVAFFVPGSPFVAEDVCRHVVRLARSRGLGVEVVPAPSFVEAVLCELDVDALEEGSLQVVDAYDIERVVLGEGALLVAQCHPRHVLSEAKTVLLDDLPPDHRVALVDAAGTSSCKVLWTALSEVDRCGLEPTPLTTLYVPAPPRAPGRQLRSFVDLVETLRGPGGCPWDAEQTHHSLARHLLEETYEVLEAIEALPPEAPRGEVSYADYARLEEELGDLLFQIAFHATLAKEAGAFTIADVARRIHEKLVQRHPHVFGDTKVSGAAEVAHNWERIKAREKARESLMDDVPSSLPALLRAHKIQRRAASSGVDWVDWRETIGEIARTTQELEERVNEQSRRVSRAGSEDEGSVSRGRPASEDPVESRRESVPWAAPPPDVTEIVGELLFFVVAAARHLRVDPEQALRNSTERFASRFRALERSAKESGSELPRVVPSDLV